eukprot:GEMP01082052.1.p1 GENE.GEMP01082052.1~~GEMP01082052.1.p1  ORF type:complete len:314 (+),score=78.20 GEMP01082052.1:65-1006(+)
MQRCPLWGLLLILHGRAGLATESFLTRRKEAHLLRSADEPEASLVLPHAADIWNAAASYAARANAAATEARAAEHQTHAGVAANAAKKPSATAVTDADDMKKFPGMVEDQRAKTKEWAALSVESLQKAEAMVDETRAKAYETAKQAAKAKVAKLEQGAHAYYQELLDQLAALASPQKDPRAEAAAAAAKPYFEVELRVLAMVLNYNLKAQELMAAAKATVTLGHTLAGKANIQQTGGNAEMAMRLMIQVGSHVSNCSAASRCARSCDFLRNTSPQHALAPWVFRRWHRRFEKCDRQARSIKMRVDDYSGHPYF